MSSSKREREADSLTTYAADTSLTKRREVHHPPAAEPENFVVDLVSLSATAQSLYAAGVPRHLVEYSDKMTAPLLRAQYQLLVNLQFAQLRVQPPDDMLGASYRVKVNSCRLMVELYTPLPHSDDVVGVLQSPDGVHWFWWRDNKPSKVALSAPFWLRQAQRWQGFLATQQRLVQTFPTELEHLVYSYLGLVCDRFFPLPDLAEWQKLLQ